MSQNKSLGLWCSITWTIILIIKPLIKHELKNCLYLSIFGGSCHKSASSSSKSNCRICLAHSRDLTFSYISVLVFSLSLNCLLSLLLLWSNSWILSNLEIFAFLYAINFLSPFVFFYDGCRLFFTYRLHFLNSLPLKIQFVILKCNTEKIWYSKCDQEQLGEKVIISLVDNRSFLNSI